MCAIAVQGPLSVVHAYMRIRKRSREGNAGGRKRRAFKSGRKARGKKSAITFARARLILICILIAVAIIGGYWFRVSPAICRGKRSRWNVSEDELFARFDSPCDRFFGFSRFAPHAVTRVADDEVSRNRRAKGQTEKGRASRTRFYEVRVRRVGRPLNSIISGGDQLRVRSPSGNRSWDWTRSLVMFPKHAICIINYA